MEVEKSISRAVECEATNGSRGPKRRESFEAIISAKGIIVLKNLPGEFYVIRLVEGDDRFIAPAQVVSREKNYTTLTWLNLLHSDREQLGQILQENQRRSPVIAAPRNGNH